MGCIRVIEEVVVNKFIDFYLYYRVCVVWGWGFRSLEDRFGEIKEVYIYY